MEAFNQNQIVLVSLNDLTALMEFELGLRVFERPLPSKVSGAVAFDAEPNDRRSVFPSMATTPFSFFARACVHAIKHSLNASGESIEKTLLNVSCEGIPLGSGKKPRSHSSLLRANNSMSLKVSAPPTMAHRAMLRISISRCRVRQSFRGSGRSLKYS